MKNSKKTRNVYISIVILAAILFAGAWLYLTNQKTILEISMDKEAYFVNESPIAEIKLKNPKTAQKGEIVVIYSDDILQLENVENSSGVTMRQVENSLIFELSKEYFTKNNPVISKLNFTSSTRGTADIKFDEKKSFLKSKNEENLQIDEFINARFSLGRPPARKIK
jgi:hypothetical protein